MTRAVRSWIIAGMAGLLLSACQPEPVTLPPGAAVYVSVISADHIMWNGEDIDLRELGRRARAQAGKTPDIRVNVWAKPETLAGDVMSVLAVLQRSGLANAGLVETTSR